MILIFMSLLQDDLKQNNVVDEILFIYQKHMTLKGVEGPEYAAKY